MTTTFVPSGHPVRRFVLALIGLTVVFAALWWSALAAPRLSAGTDASGDADKGTLQVVLANQGPFAVEVRQLSLPDGRIAVGAVSADGHDLASGPVTLAGGRTASFDVNYTVDCEATGNHPAPAVAVRVTVTTPLGIERTRSVAHTGILERACP